MARSSRLSLETTFFQSAQRMQSRMAWILPKLGNTDCAHRYHEVPLSRRRRVGASSALIQPVSSASLLVAAPVGKAFKCHSKLPSGCCGPRWQRGSRPFRHRHYDQRGSRVHGVPARSLHPGSHAHGALSRHAAQSSFVAGYVHDRRKWYGHCVRLTRLSLSPIGGALTPARSLYFLHGAHSVQDELSVAASSCHPAISFRCRPRSQHVEGLRASPSSRISG